MSRNEQKKGLSEEELRRIVEESDFSDISEQFYDSDADPAYHMSDSELNSSSSSDDAEIPRKKQKVILEPVAGPSSKINPVETILSEDSNAPQENSDENMVDDFVEISANSRIQWSEMCVPEDLNKFLFTEIPGFNPDELAKLEGREPINFYFLFIDDVIQSKLVEETNKYADQKIIDGIANESITKHSLMNQWKPIDKDELLRFLAVIIWMGLDKKPGLRDYWSTNILYKNDVSKICGISRNRFELLLHFFHISDNQLCPAGDRLYKISSLVQLLNNKFQQVCTPKESLCIDETMVPFRGRLSFLQYIPGKRHKYGIKLFKLCVTEGYTYSIKIYGGKEQPTTKSLASKVVLELMQPLLNTGRTLFTDNFYTSVELAHELNQNKTRLGLFVLTGSIIRKL